MGRLTLNILLSFAQFEREVIGERIRDKFAASRKKGMWMGGFVPLGYRVENRKLIINEDEAATVRMIFERFLKVGSATLVARALNAEGVTTRRGKPIDKGFLYKLLNNRVYIGDAVHKGTAYPGEHEAIISLDLWNRVHGILQESPRVRARRTRTTEPALLKGLIFGPAGGAMSPTYTRKGGRLYRYYVSQSVLKLGPETCPIRRVAAAEIETAVVDQLRGMLRAPEIVVRTWRVARQLMGDIKEAEVREALEQLDPIWDELFPAEQARIVQLLVERVDVSLDGVAIRLRTSGIASLIADLRTMAAPREGGVMSGAEISRDGSTLTVRVPLTFRKRGGRKLVIAPNGSDSWAPPRPRIDNTMVKAIARAFRWRKLLETGTHTTVAEIAAAEKINASYVGRVLRLTLLSPEIVEAILDGRQPAGLQLNAILKPFPVDWERQSVSLGACSELCLRKMAVLAAEKLF